MIVKVSGSVDELGNIMQVTDKMRKRELVIKVNNGQYPDYIKCEAINDKIAQTEKLRLDDEITASLILSGRKYQKKDGTGNAYYTTLKLVSIDADPVPENSLRYDAPF